MITEITYGVVKYTVIPQEEIAVLGAVENPHCYLGDGYLHCPNCRKYNHHKVMSKGHTHYEICDGCKSYVSPSGI